MSTKSEIHQDILRQIKAGAADVRKAGEELTNRIKAFESWLGKLPGRVEASYFVSGSEYAPEEGTCLAFVRDGKEWTLITYDYDAGDDSISNRKLLRDCSIKEKAWAIALFPELLKAMIEAQKSIVVNAAESVSTFDVFAKSIGLLEVK